VLEARLHYKSVPLQAQKSGAESNILWTQLGKLCTLKGNAAIDQWKAQHITVEAALERAAEAYLLAMEYNLAFGEDSREMRQAKRWIFKNIDSLQEQDLQQFVIQVKKLEKQVLKKSSELQKYLRTRGLWVEKKTTTR